MEILKYHSELDSKRFGFNICKINSFESPLAETINELKKHDYKLIISKVDSSNLKLINDLETHGFLLKDIQLTYKHDLSITDVSNIPAEITIRHGVIEDRVHLQKIADRSFENYGHYAVDEKLDSVKCRQIYSDWIGRSFDKDVADVVFVAEVDGIIAGFLSQKILSNNDTYAVGGIGAIDPEFRNKKIFKAVTLSGINWAREKKCNWVEHNVLINNFPVNRSFIKMGFKPASSVITFHKWI